MIEDNERRYGCLRCNHSYDTFWQAYHAARECGKDDCKMGPIVPTPNVSRDLLLVERQSTHGSFEHNAMISQELKEIMRNPRPGIRPPSLSVHREVLDMIALKLSRILSGQANYADHWDDIAGYAKLASEACK